MFKMKKTNAKQPKATDKSRVFAPLWSANDKKQSMDEITIGGNSIGSNSFEKSLFQ